MKLSNGKRKDVNEIKTISFSEFLKSNISDNDLEMLVISLLKPNKYPSGAVIFKTDFEGITYYIKKTIDVETYKALGKLALQGFILKAKWSASDGLDVITEKSNDYVYVKTHYGLKLQKNDFSDDVEF